MIPTQLTLFCIASTIFVSFGVVFFADWAAREAVAGSHDSVTKARYDELHAKYEEYVQRNDALRDQNVQLHDRLHNATAKKLAIASTYAHNVPACLYASITVPCSYQAEIFRGRSTVKKTLLNEETFEFLNVTRSMVVREVDLTTCQTFDYNGTDLGVRSLADYRNNLSYPSIFWPVAAAGNRKEDRKVTSHNAFQSTHEMAYFELDPADYDGISVGEFNASAYNVTVEPHMLLVSQQKTNSIHHISIDAPTAVFVEKNVNDTDTALDPTFHLPGKVKVHRYLLPTRNKGVHAIVQDPVLHYTNIQEKATRRRYAYLVCEFSTQILVWDVLLKKIVHTWDIPWQEWGFGSSEDPNVMIHPVAPHTGVFAANEDFFFTMKTPQYKLSAATATSANKGIGQGAIGRLRMPWKFDPDLDFSKEENQGNQWSQLNPNRPRWSVFKMADFASDRRLAAPGTQQQQDSKKLPFYIDAWTGHPEMIRGLSFQLYGPGSDLVWFNSITTSEVGCINITVPDESKAFELIFLPAPDLTPKERAERLATGERSLAQEEEIHVHMKPSAFGTNARPGGIVANRHGTAYASVYNSFGVLAEAIPQGTIDRLASGVDDDPELPAGIDGVLEAVRNGEERVKYTQITNFNATAFLHLSRNKGAAAKTGALGSYSRNMDLILTASSNDFGAPNYLVNATCDSGECKSPNHTRSFNNPYVPPEQADFVLVLAHINGRAIYNQSLYWHTETVMPASTQGSWLHRSWGLNPVWEKADNKQDLDVKNQLARAQPGATLYGTTELKADKLLLTQIFDQVGNGFATARTTKNGSEIVINAKDWHNAQTNAAADGNLLCTYENPTRIQEMMTDEGFLAGNLVMC